LCYEANEVDRSNLKKILLLAVACVVIAVSVVLASNWHAVAALVHPTPTPKPVMLNYTNRVYAFSLKFPQYWGDYEPNTFYNTAPAYIVRFTAPDIEGCDIPVTVTISADDLPKEALNETLEGFMTKAEAVLQANANNYRRISLTETTISGLPAKILRWTMGDNDDLINDQAIFVYNGQVYIITYSALAEFHDQVYGAFELMTSSFQFKLSGVPASPTETAPVSAPAAPPAGSPAATPTGTP
jgi:hypothetical protein